MKNILLILLVLFIIIQFFPAKKNVNNEPQPHNIASQYAMPADVKGILQKACNDCHSNNTKYPWYNTIQPVAWWLKRHVDEGKRKLNFDEFTNMPLRRQYHKLEETEEMVKGGEMPLPSYTWIHRDAILTDAEKSKLYTWVAATRANMENTYPKDSLIKSAGTQPAVK